jgi:vacuolar-type H+-ATPase subunit I/STV1
LIKHPDVGEWQKVGDIYYITTYGIPRLKIDLNRHTYEIQESKFDPIMQVFSVLVDGKFQASRHDSLERLLHLDKVSKSDMCSEREQKLTERISDLERQITNLTNENRRLELKYNDAQLIIFDSV